MSVIPLMVVIVFSMTWVIDWSMTEGVAPGSSVLTMTTGMFIVGSWSTPRPPIDTKPKTTMATKMPMAKTKRVTENRTAGLTLLNIFVSASRNALITFPVASYDTLDRLGLAFRAPRREVSVYGLVLYYYARYRLPLTSTCR